MAPCYTVRFRGIHHDTPNTTPLPDAMLHGERTALHPLVQAGGCCPASTLGALSRSWHSRGRGGFAGRAPMQKKQTQGVRQNRTIVRLETVVVLWLNMWHRLQDLLEIGPLPALGFSG